MTNIRRGPIPSDLGWLADELDAIGDRLRTLEGPDGGQAAGVLAYLAGLRTYGGTAPSFNSGSVPNDAVTRWFDSTIAITLDVPTKKLLVTASVGEASVDPDGSFVIGRVSYEIRDSSGAVLSGCAVGTNSGKIYTAERMGLSISTGPQRHEIVDPIANPGPYTVSLFGGMWVAAANAGPCSTQYNDPSLVVQVIGEGAGA